MRDRSVPASILYEDNNVEIFEYNNIETLKSWSFQFNKSTSDYCLFFWLAQ